MLADVVKLLIPCALIILLSIIFKANYPGVWVTILILPLALTPFSYLTSFLFQTEITSQIITLLINFLVCDVLALVVYFL